MKKHVSQPVTANENGGKSQVRQCVPPRDFPLIKVKGAGVEPALSCKQPHSSHQLIDGESNRYRNAELRSLPTYWNRTSDNQLFRLVLYPCKRISVRQNQSIAGRSMCYFSRSTPELHRRSGSGFEPETSCLIGM